jgi:uncharacterized protein (TIGR03086 family)
MAEMDAGVGELHIAVCRRFGDAVRSADGKWDRLSPCDGWDARAVLEHVIGFHDVLLLRPLGLKPKRPRDNPQRRWELTFRRLHEALGRKDLFHGILEVPAVGNNPAAKLDAKQLVPRLTQDVLVHTWDLARAVGADDRLDPEWCLLFFDHLPADPNALTASGMFAAPVAVDDQADMQSKLLARLGRDPSWLPRTPAEHG